MKYFTFFLLMSASYGIATASNYEEEQLSSTKKPTHLSLQLKEKIHQDINAIWDENQRLWNRNGFLENQYKEYELKLRSLSEVNRTASFSYVSSKGKKLGEDPKTSLVKKENLQPPQDLNFLDYYFPLHLPRNLRPNQTTITLKQFEEIQEAILRLSAYNDRFKSHLDVKAREWTEEKDSLLYRIAEIERSKERTENSIKELNSKILSLTLQIQDLMKQLQSTENINHQFTALNHDLQKKLSASETAVQTLSKETQSQKRKYEDSLITLKSERDHLIKEKEVLDSHILSLSEQNESYKTLIEKGQKAVQVHLKKEAKRSQKELKEISENLREDMGRIRKEKSHLEQMNEKLSKEREESARNLQRIIERTKNEKEDLMNQHREQSQKSQETLLKLQQENRVLGAEKDLQIKQYRQELEQLKHSFSREQTKEREKKENVVEISFEKEREYLVFLNHTIKKAQIPFSERPKNLIEALELIQKHFETGPS